MNINFFLNTLVNRHIGTVANAPVEITTSGFSFNKIIKVCTNKIINLKRK